MPLVSLPKALPGAPELQRGGCVLVWEGWDGLWGFAVPSTAMELAELLCFSTGTASGSSLP